MKTKTLVGLPDIHYPYHSKSAIKCVLEFIKDTKPDILVLMGDDLDLDIVSHWNETNAKVKEGQRLKAIYDGFNNDILLPLEASSTWTEKVYIRGNHNAWIDRFLEKQPQLEGMIEPEAYLQLKRRKWKIIQENMNYTIGKLSIIHGWYCNMYHAKKHIDSWGNGTCLAYGHTHTIATHSIVYRGSDGLPRMGMSCGCLCDKNPAYLRNKPTAWCHGFLYATIRDNGLFTAFPIPIIRGQFSIGKKTYGG